MSGSRRAHSNALLLAVVLALALLVAACGEPYQRPVVPPTYVVKRGDTVYSIAWKHGMDYRVLARWNNLPSDYRIAPGQVLRLRAPAGGVASVQPPRSRPAPVVPKAPPPPKPPVDPTIKGWAWPAEGKSSIVRHAASSSQGLLISGAEGAPVRAAAAGKVVYTGSGLLGFGNLLIIKHSALFLSAYGHNQALRVKEGQEVMLGQQVAEMGLGPGQKPALYFEIRYNGHPVDPEAYLPQRPGR